MNLQLHFFHEYITNQPLQLHQCLCLILTKNECVAPEKLELVFPV
jgi:hypothetical protein